MCEAGPERGKAADRRLPPSAMETIKEVVDTERCVLRLVEAHGTFTLMEQGTQGEIESEPARNVCSRETAVSATT